MKKLILFAALAGFAFPAAFAQDDYSGLTQDARTKKLVLSLNNKKFDSTTGRKEYTSLKAAEKDFPKIAGVLERIKGFKDFKDGKPNPVFILVNENMFSLMYDICVVYENAKNFACEAHPVFMFTSDYPDMEGLFAKVKKSNPAAKQKSIDFVKRLDGTRNFNNRKEIVKYINVEAGFEPDQVNEVFSFLPEYIEDVFATYVSRFGKKREDGGYPVMSSLYIVYPDGSRAVVKFAQYILHPGDGG